MSEVVAGWLIKLAWSPFLAYFWYNVRKDDKLREEREKEINKRFDSMYTQSQIDMKLEGTKQLQDQKNYYVDQRVSSLEALFTAYMAKSEERDEKLKERDDKLKEDLAEIKTNVAVISDRINNKEKDNA